MSISILLLWVFTQLNPSQIDLDHVPYGPHPETPSLNIVRQLNSIPMSNLTVWSERLDSLHTTKRYLSNGTPYTGWVYQLFLDNDHRYRYTKIEDGLAVWQIGYYANGAIDHDFHLYKGRNRGSQRMWYSDGRLYIDTHFATGGKLDGRQRRWYASGQLARDAVFQAGNCVYEVLFDREGNITKRIGTVPSTYR